MSYLVLKLSTIYNFCTKFYNQVALSIKFCQHSAIYCLLYKVHDEEPRQVQDCKSALAVKKRQLQRRTNNLKWASPKMTVEKSSGFCSECQFHKNGFYRSMSVGTDYGRMISRFQILYGQNLYQKAKQLCLKILVFCTKGMLSDKMCAENASNKYHK